MAITAEQFSQLVVDVYEAALTPSSWPTALNNITHAVDASGAGLVVAAADSRTPQCATLPVEAIDAYRAHYREVDYVLADVESGPVGVVRSGPEVIDPMGDAEFDADWMRPNNVQDGLFVRLTDTDWPTSFLLAAPRRSRPFATPERIQVVTALVPHLQQALRAQDQIAGGAQWAHDLADVIDTSTDGMVLVDARGQVLHVNNAAHVILTAGDGITVRNNHLHASHLATDQALARGIASGAGPDDAVPRGDVLACPRPSGTRAYLLHIVPLRAEQDGAVPGRVLIALIDPARETKPDKALLQRLFGLTSAEADVALEMLTGLGLPAVAEDVPFCHHRAITSATGLRQDRHPSSSPAGPTSGEPALRVTDPPTTRKAWLESRSRRQRRSHLDLVPSGPCDQTRDRTSWRGPVLVREHSPMHTGAVSYGTRVSAATVTPFRWWAAFAFGRNPLARATDRVEAWARVVGLLVVIAAVYPAVLLGNVGYAERSHTIAAEAAARHPVEATALSASRSDPSQTETTSTTLLVPVRWTVQSTVHEATTKVEHPVKAGEQIRIWLNADGKVTSPPLTSSDAQIEAIGLGVLGWLTMAAVVGGALAALRRSLGRIRDRRWDRGLRELVDTNGGSTNPRL